MLYQDQAILPLLDLPDLPVNQLQCVDPTWTVLGLHPLLLLLLLLPLAAISSPTRPRLPATGLISGPSNRASPTVAELVLAVVVAAQVAVVAAAQSSSRGSTPPTRSERLARHWRRPLGSMGRWCRYEYLKTDIIGVGNLGPPGHYSA